MLLRFGIFGSDGGSDEVMARRLAYMQTKDNYKAKSSDNNSSDKIIGINKEQQNKVTKDDNACWIFDVDCMAHMYHLIVGSGLALLNKTLHDVMGYNYVGTLATLMLSMSESITT